MSLAVTDVGLSYLMLTFKKAQLTSLTKNCVGEILPLPASLVINFYLFAPLTFIHLLRQNTPLKNARTKCFVMLGEFL